LIKTYYLNLRSNRGGDSTPVTARQLESLIRLTEVIIKIKNKIIFL